jgi:hypothetical protein
MDLQPSGEAFKLSLTSNEHGAASKVLDLATNVTNLSEAQGLAPQPSSAAFDELRNRLYDEAEPLSVTGDELDVLCRGLVVARAADQLYGGLDSHYSRVLQLDRNLRQQWPRQQ